MTIRITSQLTPSLNEAAPGILLDPRDVAFAQAASSRLLLKGGKAMVQGIVSARPFRWRSFVAHERSDFEAVDESHLPIVADDYLGFGYGDDLDADDNGALISPATYEGLSYGTGWTMIAAFRCPPDGGGAIVGNSVNQTGVYSTSTNNRWSGLSVGYGESVAVGEFRASLAGDAIFIDPPGANNWRDGEWHVGSGIFDWAGQTLVARVDGGNQGSMSTWASGGTVRRDISTVGGGNRLRLAAAGFADQAPTYRFVGDIGEVFVAAAPLSGSALTDIENAVMGRYGLM